MEEMKRVSTPAEENGNGVGQALEELLGHDLPLVDMPAAREFVRRAEAEMAGMAGPKRARIMKAVAKAYDQVRRLSNHSRALRERVQELNREAGL